MPPVTDPTDVRVLIPRVRRAVDGPEAVGSGSVSATLDDDQVKNIIADAIADVILYTNGVFGTTLEVTARDAYYTAPTEYKTGRELTLTEGAVIAAQAALNFHFYTLRELKVSETITNEAEEWSYSLSATMLKDLLKALQDARDRALDALRDGNPNLDSYISFIAVRDAATSLAIEPWVQGSGYSGDTRSGFADPNWF